MTYERIKTGTFRVCVFLTILLEALAFLGQWENAYQRYTRILGFRFDMINVVWATPFIIWGTYFFGLWIAKGYMGKK